MGRKERSAREQARRARIRESLELGQVSGMEDMFKETIAEFMEDGQDAELSEELGYSKYDYRNKETDKAIISSLASSKRAMYSGILYGCSVWSLARECPLAGRDYYYMRTHHRKCGYFHPKFGKFQAVRLCRK